MTTRFVGLKEFRANIIKITQEAKKKRQHVIVTSRNLPMFGVSPLLAWDEEGVYKESFVRETMKTLREDKKSRTYTSAEVLKALQSRRRTRHS